MPNFVVEVDFRTKGRFCIGCWKHYSPGCINTNYDPLESNKNDLESNNNNDNNGTVTNINGTTDSSELHVRHIRSASFSNNTGNLTHVDGYGLRYGYMESLSRGTGPFVRRNI